MKKVLIGSYLLIIILVIVVIFNNPFKQSHDSKAVLAGEKVYQKQCMICHGKTGKGEGAKVGTALNNQHYLSTVSDKDLYQNIKYGRVGTAMPALSSKVSETDLNNLVTYIRNWQTEKIKFKVPERLSGNVNHGKQLYQLYCSSCHGERGSGKATMGPQLANPQFLKYTSNRQIWIMIAYGREETRMSPSLKGFDGVRQLKKEDITDLVAYIRSLQIKK